MNETPPVAPPAAEPRPLNRLMVAVVAALMLTLAASCVSVVFDINRLNVLSHFTSDVASRDLIRLQSDQAAAQTSDNQTSAIAAVELLVFIASGVCFIAWFHRAYSNLRALCAADTRYGAGWAIGGWFVPILNLWRPKQIANDIWRGSDPDHPGEQPTWGERVSPLPRLWWAAVLVLGLLNRSLSEERQSASTVHRLRSATGLDIAAEVTSIITAGLAIAVVRTLTNRLSERAQASREAVAA